MKLIDTNIAIYVIDLHPRAIALIDQFEKPPFLSAISIMELFHGAESTQDEEDIYEFMRGTHVIDVTTTIAIRAGKILQEINKRSKKKTSKEDMLLAATALTLNIPFITANWKDFQHIHGLMVEKFIP